MSALITNHGKHSDEKLAIACAQDIVQIGADAAGEQAIEGRKLENKIVEIMEAHFRALAVEENDNMGHELLALSFDPHPEIHGKAINDILAAIGASPIGKWFGMDGAVGELARNAGASPSKAATEVRRNVETAVGKWIKVSQHMHRDWFARHGMVGHGTALTGHPGHDPENEHVRRWKDIHDGPTPEAYRQAIHEHATNLKA
jgi:hypothetical protein